MNILIAEYGSIFANLYKDFLKSYGNLDNAATYAETIELFEKAARNKNSYVELKRKWKKELKSY